MSETAQSLAQRFVLDTIGKSSLKPEQVADILDLSSNGTLDLTTWNLNEANLFKMDGEVIIALTGNKEDDLQNNRCLRAAPLVLALYASNAQLAARTDGSPYELKYPHFREEAIRNPYKIESVTVIKVDYNQRRALIRQLAPVIDALGKEGRLISALLEMERISV